MFCLSPSSTSLITYRPQLDGADLPESPTYDVKVVINGVSTSVNDNVQWEAPNLKLALPASAVPMTSNYSTASIVWTWTYLGQTLRDVEKVVISDSNFKELPVKLRQRIKDTGIASTKYIIGDGVTTEFSVTKSYADPYKMTVLSGGIITPTSAYTYDIERGTITFTSAVASQESVTVLFMGYDYSPEELEDYIHMGISDHNRYLATTLDTFTYPTSEDTKELVLLFATRNLYVMEMLGSNRDSISWRDEEKSVSRTSVPRNYAETIKALEAQIKELVVRVTRNSTRGVAIVGGNTELVLFDDVDWSSANG